MLRAAAVRNSTFSCNATVSPHDPPPCPPYWMAYFETVDSSVPYLVNAGLNVLMAIIATLANLLVLLAMPQVAIRFPSKILLAALVVTDFATGFIVHPLLTAFLLMKTNFVDTRHCSLVMSVILISMFFSSFSYLTMTAIGLDRYIALFSHLSYQTTVTSRRVFAVLACLWLFSLFVASTWLWNLALKTFLTIFVMVICVLIVSVSYFKIYRGLRAQQLQIQALSVVQAPQHVKSAFNMARYKRTASTMLLIYALFILCYLSFFCMSVTVSFIEYTPLTQCIYEFSVTIALLNSSLNPFVYCLRLPEVRTEVFKLVRMVCCREASVVMVVS